ncbi:CopG domain protein [Natronomonas moolapensis 8.8.11]|uniref:CopG domain protein n=1 Tax=Natronomonas moolapensis (strain DSM 18674 / CECT 7526 / JCM 14361 / 8.8.11) TaxID=268739 RepID=M1XLE4_NATM8|nr:hypothetical protein [Natronomonas moolapensis]CCQ37568.1 CopG domain protein [Natronomonas moolapensis 8.8.11]
MATESAGDPKLSVTLPPSLSEWLDERAATLGMEPEALLVQLLETHRSAADLDENWIETLEDRLEDVDARVERTDSRVDDVETKLATNVEDVRERVLQLRDAVEERAPAEHSHGEFRSLADRIDELSTALEAVESEVQALEGLEESVDRFGDAVESNADRIDTAESKLDRIARAVVARNRREAAEADSEERLHGIRRDANRTGAFEANCASCGEPIRIGLLSEAACPHCERGFDGLETPSSVLRWFKRPTLTVVDDGEGAPEAEAEAGDGDGGNVEADSAAGVGQTRPAGGSDE